MKKIGLVLGATAVGMVGGAVLYSYSISHPLKMEMAKNKIRNAMKDLR